MTTDVDAPIAPGSAPEEATPPATSFQVQLVIHGHRLTGLIHTGGIPQRMTDFLNNHDGSVLFMEHGEVEDILEGGGPRPLAVAQIRLDTILFAAPRAGLPSQGDPFERVQKQPVAVRVALPGYDLSGKVFLLPGASLAQTPVTGKRFAPLVETTIVPSGRPDRAWQEPIVAFNLARAVIYAAP